MYRTLQAVRPSVPAASSITKPTIRKPPRFFRRIAPIPVKTSTPGITSAYTAPARPSRADSSALTPDVAMVVICSALLLDPFGGGAITTGLNVQVAAPGSPEHDRFTWSEKPFCEVTVRFTVPNCPGVSVSDDGLAVTVNPVSYTHLDVYKRQSKYYALAGASASGA